MMQAVQHARIFLDYYDGHLSGFASAIPAFPRPCRFECIAMNADSVERVFVVAAIEQDDLEKLCALLGTRDDLVDPRRYNASQLTGIDALAAATLHRLTRPDATLVWADQIERCPERTHRVGPHGARVAEAIGQPMAHAPSEWADAREQARDWLDETRDRLTASAASPEIPWLIEEIRDLRRALHAALPET